MLLVRAVPGRRSGEFEPVLTDLQAQRDAGQRSRGRMLSDSGPKARFFHEVAEAHLASIVKVDLRSDFFR